MGTVVIPAPIEVDEIMREVPKGKLITINEIRALLASKHKATIWLSDYDRDLCVDCGKCRR